MKSLRHAFLALALSVVSFAAEGNTVANNGATATSTAPSTPNAPKRPLVDLIALEYLPLEDAAVDGQLARDGIVQPMAGKVKARLNAMRAAKAEGLTPDTKWFWARLDEQSNATATVPPASQAAADTNDAAQKMRAAGLSSYYINAMKDGAADTSPVVGPFKFFHTGVRVLSPYHVNGASAVENGTTKTGGFLEFVYTDIWAWRENRVGQTKEWMRRINATAKGKVDDFVLEENRRRAEKRKERPDDPAWQKLYAALPELGLPTYPYHAFSSDDQSFYMGSSVWGWNEWRYGWDFTSRLSFEFGAGAEPSASTIAGSGDFSASAALDKHIFHGWTPDSIYSINLGVSASAVTEGHSLRIHPHYLMGPSYVIAFKDPLRQNRSTEDIRKAVLSVRVGRSYSDSVKFLRDKSVLRTVNGKEQYVQELDPQNFIGTAQNPPAIDPMTLVTTSPGVPRFYQKIGWGFELEVYYPLGGQSLLTLGARGDQGKSLALSPWSLFLGVTTPLTKVASDVMPK